MKNLLAIWDFFYFVFKTTPLFIFYFEIRTPHLMWYETSLVQWGPDQFRITNVIINVNLKQRPTFILNIWYLSDNTNVDPALTLIFSYFLNINVCLCFCSIVQFLHFRLIFSNCELRDSRCIFITGFVAKQTLTVTIVYLSFLKYKQHNRIGI